jgi:protein TonB
MLLTQSNVAPEVWRLTFAALPSSVITTLLLIVMLQLIVTDVQPITEPTSKIMSVVMDPPEEIDEREPLLERPVEPETPPDWEPELSLPTIEVAGITPGSPVFDFNPQDGTIETGRGGGIFAYVRVEPVYPNRALARGIEGFVDLAFDITGAGGTTNIRVIDADPQGVFERAAMRALQKWKYKVPLEDGIATGQRDMTTRIRFKLEE